MTDTLTRRARSALMARITGDRLKPETRLRAALRRLHVPFEANVWRCGCRPDLVIDGFMVVMVHGCFWHGCRRHYRTPKTRAAHWDRHVGANRRRDARNARRLRRAGYSVQTVWEHDLRTDDGADEVAVRLIDRYFRL